MIPYIQALLVMLVHTVAIFNNIKYLIICKYKIGCKSNFCTVASESIARFKINTKNGKILLNLNLENLLANQDPEKYIKRSDLSLRRMSQNNHVDLSFFR